MPGTAGPQGLLPVTFHGHNTSELRNDGIFMDQFCPEKPRLLHPWNCPKPARAWSALGQGKVSLSVVGNGMGFKVPPIQPIP